MTTHRTTFACLLTLTLLLAPITDSFAAGKNQKLCVTANGLVQIKKKCGKGEQPFSLGLITTQQGPQGPQGTPGEKGDQGPAGPGFEGLETVVGAGDKITIPAATILPPVCVPFIPGQFCCDPMGIPIPGCGTTIPGVISVEAACPDGKVIFASTCPEKTVGAAPGTQLLTGSNSANGKTFKCSYSNPTNTIEEIGFTPTVLCGTLPAVQ